MGLPGAEGGVGNDILKKRDVGLDAADAELAQRAIHALAGHREIPPHGGDLHQHRIIVGRDHRAGIARGGIQADAKAGGRAVVEDAAVIRREIFHRVLGGDAALDGEADAGNLVLRRDGKFLAKQGMALGDEDLRAHQINPGDAFGDGVLDLDTRIHLNEEPVIVVHVIEKLDRAGVVVADAFGELDRGLAKLLAHRRIQVHGRRDFDDFLIASLHRTIAFVQMDDVAVLVAENLHLDMLGAGNVALQEHRGIAESIERLVLGFGEQGRKLRGFFDHPHAAATATEGRLDDEWKTDVMGDGERFVRIGDGLLGARQGRHIEGVGQGAGGGLVAHFFQQVRRWSDERYTLAGTGPGEVGIFRQKPIARMDHRDALLFGECDDALDIQIGTDGPLRGVQWIGLVGLEAVD